MKLVHDLFAIIDSDFIIIGSFDNLKEWWKR